MAQTRPRPYYSARTRRSPEAVRLSLDNLKALFANAYSAWTNGGYFDEQFGSYCVDQGDVPGLVGENVADHVFLCLMKPDLWPIRDKLEGYDEEDLFDMLELLFDHISKPTEGHFHSFAGCGMHWSGFDAGQGQLEYRDRLNVLLERYGPGYEMNDRGEIMVLGARGLNTLLHRELPTKEKSVLERVQSAADRFRRYGSTADDRRQAVRDLADVLEFLRPQIKTALLKKDESALFEIMNNFAIRHHNTNQKADYDTAVWLSWMFHFFLASIHASLHLIERQAPKPKLLEAQG